MAHSRTLSNAAADSLREPHPVSLKVLRLSRPSFAVQHPLPDPSPSSTLARSICPDASQAYTSISPQTPRGAFVLSPLLTLPPAFGNAYVGETFACTLCANNELLKDAKPSRNISGVRIEAEMKTPSLTTPLDVVFASTIKPIIKERELEKNFGAEQLSNGGDLAACQSMQGIVEFHLKEEGDYVLVVTISYTETGATSGRVRSFRKLYQFVARGCLVVRTKTGPLLEAALTYTGKRSDGKRQRKLWALEAQLENCGQEVIVLDIVALETKSWCKATSLNWDGGGDEYGAGERNPILAPNDVHQVCFLVERIGDEVEQEVDTSNKLVIGMLSIGWRGPMGNRGTLTTGWLGTKLR